MDIAPVEELASWLQQGNDAPVHPPGVQKLFGTLNKYSEELAKMKGLQSEIGAIENSIAQPGAVLWGENYIRCAENEELFHLADALHVFFEGDRAVAECYLEREKDWDSEPFATYRAWAQHLVDIHENFRGHTAATQVMAVLAFLSQARSERGGCNI